LEWEIIEYYPQTPTPTPTRTPTPTPTPTPSPDILNNAIITNNYEYISIGNEEYLKYQ
jgi:hypothetical protein